MPPRLLGAFTGQRLNLKHERSPRADSLSRFLSNSPWLRRSPSYCLGLHAPQRTPEPGAIFLLQCGVGEAALLGFSPALRLVDGHSAPKDTLHNIRETGEFVVNVVTFAVADAMNLTSGEYDSSVDEFALAKLKTRPSQVVRPPQVAESPVSFECKLNRIIDFGTEPPSGSLVIGEIVCVHLEKSVLKEDRLDPDMLDLIGRMGGVQYSRTTERFDLKRPEVRAPETPRP